MARRVRRCGGTTDERVVRRTGGDSIPVWERKEGNKRAGGRRQHGRPTWMEEERHDAPEEVEEPERLDDHARERPLGEDEQDAAEEAERATQLLLAREEVERLVGPDDERQPGDEENLQSGVGGFGGEHAGGRQEGSGDTRFRARGARRRRRA